ncbi:MAG: acetoacetate decarboxylase family protein [Cyanobacteria bacterium P01_G01_bin.19]
MRNIEFFQQIEHMEIPWEDKTIFFPVFYYDVATLSMQCLASIERIRKILPSTHMHPLRITPWHCVVSISAFEYLDSDIGAYNEVSIGVPIVLNKASPLFVGTLSKVPTIPQVYIHHLPVTTEIARKAGLKFGGYPKFLADIEFERDSQWVSCQLRADSQHILTLKGREGKFHNVARSRMQPITVRSEHMLRCELIVSERNQLESRSASDVHLELGDHPIAQEMKKWKLGRILGYQYAPQHQAILTPVVESFAV